MNIVIVMNPKIINNKDEHHFNIVKEIDLLSGIHHVHFDGFKGKYLNFYSQ